MSRAQAAWSLKLEYEVPSTGYEKRERPARRASRLLSATPEDERAVLGPQPRKKHCLGSKPDRGAELARSRRRPFPPATPSTPVTRGDGRGGRRHRCSPSRTLSGKTAPERDNETSRHISLPHISKSSRVMLRAGVRVPPLVPTYIHAPHACIATSMWV